MHGGTFGTNGGRADVSTLVGAALAISLRVLLGSLFVGSLPTGVQVAVWLFAAVGATVVGGVVAVFIASTVLRRRRLRWPIAAVALWVGVRPLRRMLSARSAGSVAWRWALRR